jgi:hypothetical protein
VDWFIEWAWADRHATPEEPGLAMTLAALSLGKNGKGLCTVRCGVNRLP